MSMRTQGTETSRCKFLMLSFTLLAFLVAVPQLNAQSNDRNDPDSYKLRINAYWFYAHPSGTNFRYQPIAEPEESGNGGRVRWVSGRPGEAPAYAGTDFMIARDGRIAALYLFFDELPWAAGRQSDAQDWQRREEYFTIDAASVAIQKFLADRVSGPPTMTYSYRRLSIGSSRAAFCAG
jgi:hypothetical protein